MLLFLVIHQWLPSLEVSVYSCPLTQSLLGKKNSHSLSITQWWLLRNTLPVTSWSLPPSQMDTATLVKPAKGRSLPPPPPLSSSSDGVKEMQLLAKTRDAGERNMNNLLADENNQKLDCLTERLSSLGKWSMKWLKLFICTMSASYPSLSSSFVDNRWSEFLSSSISI